MPELVPGLQRLTRMAALNGGLTGVVARWAVIDIDPALWPQLHCVCNSYERLMAEGVDI